MDKSKTDKAITYACRLFGVRPRSERELRNRLRMKGFDGVTIEGVISFLKEKKVIDDFKFAKVWIDSRMHTRPKGDILLRKELQDKGISASAINRALSEKKEDEGSTARVLAKRRLESLKTLPKMKAKKRLFDFLARRGFDFDVIKEVIKESFDNTD